MGEIPRLSVDFDRLCAAPAGVIHCAGNFFVASDAHIISLLFGQSGEGFGRTLIAFDGYRPAVLSAFAGVVLNLIPADGGVSLPLDRQLSAPDVFHAGEGGLFRHDLEVDDFRADIAAFALEGNLAHAHRFVAGIGDAVVGADLKNPAAVFHRDS